MPDRQESCCFTGHRPAKLPWRSNEQDPRCLALKRRIAEAVESACEMDYRHFLCGMATGCDLYFCEAVLEAKQHHAISLEAAIPCPTQADRWSASERKRYARLLEQCDFQTMVSHSYNGFCMQRRNRYMVDHASMIIAVFNGTPGGTRSTLEYAFRRGLYVLDIPLDPV